jgi:catechol 2,3-dioxygenase-like lactoylglutathione lyase family enzyme
MADLDRSLAFYVNVIDSRVLFDRPEERFAFLDLDGVHLMLEEAAGPGRRFRTAPLEHPYGRGVNFQIEVADVMATYERVCAAQTQVLIPLEERWYRQQQTENGNRQFVVVDPDGYLLRFCSTIVPTSCSTSSGTRASVKQPANRSVSRIARSVSPSSSAPASEVIAPPSKAATTWRPSTGANSNSVGLHSVGTGEFLRFAKRLCCRRTFADSEPRCTYLV